LLHYFLLYFTSIKNLPIWVLGSYPVRSKFLSIKISEFFENFKTQAHFFLVAANMKTAAIIIENIPAIKKLGFIFDTRIA